MTKIRLPAHSKVSHAPEKNDGTPSISNRAHAATPALRVVIVYYRFDTFFLSVGPADVR